jgi:hypothetical protein
VARSVRTIPFAVVSVTPPPAAVTDDQTRSKPKRARRRKPLISDDQWAQIEKAYGYKLDAAIRFEVLRVTTLFVMFEPFERAALPLAEAKKRVQSIKDSAGKFFSDLFSGPSNDATTFADELIDRHFNGRLREVLLSLAAACNSALAEMESSPSHREGACWDRWICDLTTILAAAGLPVAASKGSGKSKSDSPSAFVSLVLKLQEPASRRTGREPLGSSGSGVPKEARRHNTPDGLASAINRARKGLGSKPKRPSTKK